MSVASLRELESPRWLMSAAVVLALHGGIATALLDRRLIEPAAAPTPALLLDLAPLLSAPAVDRVELPPGPQQVEAKPPPESEPEPEKVEETPPPEPEPQPAPVTIEEPPPVVKPAVVLPPSMPKPKPRRPVPPAPPVDKAEPTPDPLPLPPAPVSTAPPAAALRQTPADSLPQGVRSPIDPDAVALYNARLHAHIKKHMRYPREALRRSQRGDPVVHFVIDRAGHVLSARLESSSGNQALDADALELFRRAEPLPEVPEEIAGPTLERVLPLRYILR